MSGPFIDSEYETVAKSNESYGRDRQCAALAQRQGGSGAPNSSTWTPGIRVLDAAAGEIAKGTVIATFWAGGYPPGSGKHTALYVSHSAPSTDSNGAETGGWIEVIDQWEQQVDRVVDNGGVKTTIKEMVAVPPAKAREVRGKNGRINSNPKLYVPVERQQGANAPASRPRLSNIAEFYHVVMAD